MSTNLIIVDKGKIIFKNTKGNTNIKDKLLDKDTSSIVFDFLYGNRQYYKSIFNKTINHINTFTDTNMHAYNYKCLFRQLIAHDNNHIKLSYKKCKFLLYHYGWYCPYHYYLYR